MSASIVELSAKEHPPSNSLVLFDSHDHLDDDRGIILHGAVELSANGPGRMLYLIYHGAEDEWYELDQWGIPHLADLDGDGSLEIVSQFEGLHLHGPDVAIFRWKDDRLERSDTIKNALSLNRDSWSRAEWTPSEEGQYRIVVYVTQQLGDFESNTTATYQFESEQYMKIHEERE